MDRSAHPTRRRFLTASLATSVAGAASLLLPGRAAGSSLSGGAPLLPGGSGTPRPRPTTPSEALRELAAGNARFTAGDVSGPNRSLQRIAELAPSQAPFAAILGCADSRVPPELLFDQGFGDLFVVRVAGNVATPEELASLEFAVAALGAVFILVLGHSECGAVKAALDGSVPPGQISSLFQHIVPGVADAEGDVPAAIESNALHQMMVVRQGSPLLAAAVREGRLGVGAGVYDLVSGRVRMLGTVGVDE